MLGLSELPASMRRNLALEIGYCICSAVVSALGMSAQVAVVGSLRGSEIAVTILVAVIPASSLLQPFWAALARQVKLQHMVLVSGSLRILPFLLVGWVDNVWAFVACNVAYYVLASPLALAVPSLYRYTYAGTHRGRVIGLLRMAQNMVSVATMLGGALLLDLDPPAYRLLYPVAGLVGIVGLLFYSAMHMPTDLPTDRAAGAASPSLSTIQAVLREDTPFRLFQLSIFLTGAGFLMSRPIWIYLLIDRFHLGQTEVTFLSHVMPLLLGAITSPGWGILIDRTSPVAGRLAFAWLGIFAYAALFASFYWHRIELAYVGAVLRGIVLGAAEVSLTTGNLYFSLKRERAALYESISSLFQGVRGLFLPMVGYGLFVMLDAWLFLFPAVLNLLSLQVARQLWRVEIELRESYQAANRS